MTVIEQAYAKINLCLDIVGCRPDGYHELLTVMQTLSLCDTLRLTREGREVVLVTDGSLPTDERNLVCRAASAYFAASGDPFGVRVELEKRIPVQAGLGGGSADAAAMLRALNVLDGNRFSTEQLCAIGATVGADVPFCVKGGTQMCEGIGERMTAVHTRLAAHAVVAMKGEGVSTPRAFAALDARYGDFAALAATARERTDALVRAMQSGELHALAPLAYNRFEEVIEAERPAVRDLKRALLECGAVLASMSGSGPAVFGLFDSKKAAEAAALSLGEQGTQAFACEIK